MCPTVKIIVTWISNVTASPHSNNRGFSGELIMKSDYTSRTHHWVFASDHLRFWEVVTPLESDNIANSTVCPSQGWIAVLGERRALYKPLGVYRFGYSL